MVGRIKSLFPYRPRHCTNDQVTSHWVYQFMCFYEKTYIKRSNRTIEPRFMKHAPRCLQNQLMSNAPINVGSRKSCSMTAKHVIEAKHIIVINIAFKTSYRNYKGWILKFIEALAIHKFKHTPILCTETFCRNLVSLDQFMA